MKQMISTAILVFLIMPKNVYALPNELMDCMPQEVQEIWAAAEQENLQGTWRSGLQQLWTRVTDYFVVEAKQNLRGAILVLLIAIFVGIAESCYQTAENETVPNYVPLAGTLVITGVVVGDVQTMIGLGEETIGQLHVLSEAILPTLSAAVSASGGMVSASVRQVATVFFCNLLISAIKTIFLPLLSLLIVLSAADSCLPGHSIGKIVELIRKGITWALTAALVIFTGYLTISGAAAGAADNLTAQLTRSAISTAVPVVGSIISEATGSVLAGAAVLKNSIGILGMLGVLTVCLTPFLTLALQYLLYKASALLSGVFSDTLTGYIQSLSSAFGLLLGMAGTCALLLLISISSSVTVVIR